MGRTVFIMIALLVVVVGTIIVSINNEQVNLSSGLADDNDMKLAKFISNTYAHNTIKDIRSAINSTFTSAPNYYKNEENVLDIPNSKAKVLIYTDSLPGIKTLNPSEEWGVMSIGIVNAAVCTTRTVYKRMPYSEFGLFTDNFPKGTYFGDGEMIDGPAYINGNLRVGTNSSDIFNSDSKSKNKNHPFNHGKHNGWRKKRSTVKEYPADAGPVFTDLVYITGNVKSDSSKYADGTTFSEPDSFWPYFNGFRNEEPTFGYPKIAMPNEQFNISSTLRNAALNPFKDTSKDYTLLKITLLDTQIQFYREYKIKKTTKNETETLNISDLKKNNYLIYNSDSSIPIYVKGSLNGKLTIATEGIMYANGSIVYTSVKNNLDDFKQKCIDGEYQTLPNNDQSILGLLSVGRFIVEASTENKATNDIIIMANIFTQSQLEITQGQVYNNYKWQNDAPRHFIVYGSRVQGELQPGTFTSNSVKKEWYHPKGWAWGWRWRVNYLGGSGLKEVISYDRRFKEMSPPCTPYTDKGARISVWDEKFGKIEVKD